VKRFGSRAVKGPGRAKALRGPALPRPLPYPRGSGPGHVGLRAMDENSGSGGRSGPPPNRYEAGDT